MTLHSYLSQTPRIIIIEFATTILPPRHPPYPLASNGLLRSAHQQWRPGTSLVCPCSNPQRHVHGAPSWCHHTLQHNDSSRLPSTLRWVGVQDDTGASAGCDGLALPPSGPIRIGVLGTLGGIVRAVLLESW